MTGEGEKSIAEMLRALRAGMAELRRDMVTLTLRQNASEHFEQGLMAHVASMHSTLDELKGDMRLVKARLDLVDGEA